MIGMNQQLKIPRRLQLRSTNYDSTVGKVDQEFMAHGGWYS